uniref:CRAL-TRIO domain-containing protein n=1 Tax=Strigamia maritima TaxID=126957 RepID=T1J3G4_STRMM
MCLEVLIEVMEEGTNQVVFVIDASGIGVQHAKQLTPSNVKKLIALLEPFLSISERIIFHGKNMESLHRCVDVNILPKEFGGPQQPISSGHTCKKLWDHEKYLEKINSFGYNKSKWFLQSVGDQN